MSLFFLILPELVLIATACLLFLLGISLKPAARRLAPVLALLALAVAFYLTLTAPGIEAGATAAGRQAPTDPYGAFRIGDFALYIKMLASGVGVLFVLLAWPGDPQATGNSALEFGSDAGEFFALLLLSISGILLVAGANDIVLLFLGVELASIPTYIMVSISRPLPVAQEAGVKYFFLGAMAAAIMLFGFSYLYGATGLLGLDQIMHQTARQMLGPNGPTVLSTWHLLAAVMLITGLSFKMAAVPLHFYAGDVYQGAATPVTALLSFVPKISGFVALIKVLYALSGGSWGLPAPTDKLIWVLAVLTMSVGNVLGLMQNNVKRVLAYSSIAHTGYMLVGVTALLHTGHGGEGLQGVLFYLAAYGIMNAGAFGVLMLLPAKRPQPATSAETFDDLAGAGRRNVALGLAMAVACFSLIGLPLTIGFFGKIYLIRPALVARDYWLVVIMVINAAISAGYYLRIVAAMFLPPAGEQPPAPEGFEAHPLPAAPQSLPISLAIGLSVAGTLLFGAVFPATEVLHTAVIDAANIDLRPTGFQLEPGLEPAAEEEAAPAAAVQQPAPASP